MNNGAKNTLYSQYSGIEANITDNKIGTPEHIIRHFLLHAYEDGFRLGSKYRIPFAELLFGAVLTCLCSGIVALSLKRYFEAMIWFGITALMFVLIVIIYIYDHRKNIPDFEDICKDRDMTVNNYIEELYSGASMNQTVDAIYQSYNPSQTNSD